MINRFSGILKLKLSILGQLGYMVTTSGTVSVTREASGSSFEACNQSKTPASNLRTQDSFEVKR
jgi:hypothetical protein